MVRATNNETKIVHPFTTRPRCTELNMEAASICLEGAACKINDSIMSSNNDISKNLHNGSAQGFESYTELNNEYKELLVRTVADRIKRKMHEEDMWKEIQKETGYDHKNVWIDMRNTTMKKIMCLLPANDLLENIPAEIQLSVAEWMLFDLVLVHEEINVISLDPLTESPDQILDPPQNANNNEEPQCLQELFDLVKQHDIENLTGKALADAWSRLSLQYNSRGRYCSPMLLQLRWYQMKKMTRCCFYKSYVRNVNSDIQESLQSVVVVELSVLQIAIAVMYNKLMIEECPSWKTLINEGRVILSEEFANINLTSKSTSQHRCDNNTDVSQAQGPSNTPPILLIKLDEDQKILNEKGDIITGDDTIVFDLEDDTEYAVALQNVLGRAAEVSSQVEKNKHENAEEEFKQRLVREVAIMSRLKQNEKCLWQQLKKKLGRDCKNIWNQMRNSTAKKVSRMIAGNDLFEDVLTTMRPTPTEWLLYDLMLVHEKINIVNLDNMEATCLRDLFELVNEYQIEDLVGEQLAEAWINLTLKYNSGGRQCSPMLLQLRWYQLKQLSRQQIFKPHGFLSHSKTKVLREIATKYQKIITQKFSAWSTYIREKCVILPEEFVMTLKQKGKWKNVEAREGWYLHVKEAKSISDDEITVEDTPRNVNRVVSKLAECNTKNKSDVMLQQKAKKSSQLRTPAASETKEPVIIELDSDDEINEILREKAENIRKNSQLRVENVMRIPQVQLEFDNIDKDNQGERSKRTHQTVYEAGTLPSNRNNELILCDSDDEMDKLLQEKVDLISTEISKSLKSLGKTIGDEMNLFKKGENHELCRMEVEEIGIVNKEMVMVNKHYEGLDEVYFDDNDIEFVDDGIEFEDDNEYSTKEVTSEVTKEPTTASSSDDDSERTAEIDDEDNQIDLKLLMNTAVFTKKMDSMEVFKFIDYDYVNDKRIIDHVESESKPEKWISKNTKIDNFRERAIPEYDKESQCSVDIVEASFQKPENRVKCTSWLLQKPRKRRYVLKKLNKNPDFNTELKILTPEFFSSARNRGLLRECRPLTIDVHRAFEKKLVNGTLYLKHAEFKSSKSADMDVTNNYKSTIASPLIPGMFTEDQRIKIAEHVRNLIAAVTDDNQDAGDLQPKLPIKRSKIINLPDKDQIRVINQSLLTAEISPRHQPLLNSRAINATKSNIKQTARIISSSEESPNKRFKKDLTTSEALPSQIYCCWARERMTVKGNSNLECSKHMCLDNCTCCCRLALGISRTSKRSSSPQLRNKSFQKLPESLNLIDKSNSKIVRKVYRSAPFKSKVGQSVISGASNVVKDRNLKDKGGTSLPNACMRDASRILNYTIDSSTLLKKSEVCAKTTVQTVAKATKNYEQRENVKITPTYKRIALRPNLKSLQVPETSCLILPSGVNFVKLGNGKLAAAINPGVQLDPEQINTLVSVCASTNYPLSKQHSKESQVPPLLYFKKPQDSLKKDPVSNTVKLTYD